MHVRIFFKLTKLHFFFCTKGWVESFYSSFSSLCFRNGDRNYRWTDVDPVENLFFACWRDEAAGVNGRQVALEKKRELWRLLEGRRYVHFISQLFGSFIRSVKGRLLTELFFTLIDTLVSAPYLISYTHGFLRNPDCKCSNRVNIFQKPERKNCIFSIG